VLERIDIVNCIPKILSSFDALDVNSVLCIQRVVEYDLVSKEELLRWVRETSLIRILVQGFSHPEVSIRKLSANFLTELDERLGSDFEPYIGLLKVAQKNLSKE